MSWLRKRFRGTLNSWRDLRNVSCYFYVVNQPVLLQEYADFLVDKKGLELEQAYVEAQREFIERGISGNPVCKYELAYWDQLKRMQADEDATVLHPQLRDADVPTILKKAVEWGDLILPTKRSVHAVPDLESYIPEQYYEPLANHDFKIKLEDPLSPHLELKKYHAKKASLVV